MVQWGELKEGSTLSPSTASTRLGSPSSRGFGGPLAYGLAPSSPGLGPSRDGALTSLGLELVRPPLLDDGACGPEASGQPGADPALPSIRLCRPFRVARFGCVVRFGALESLVITFLSAKRD